LSGRKGFPAADAFRRVEPTFVVIPYSRTFPYPVDQAFAWLTDYQDDDPSRTDAIVERRTVAAREKDVVTLDATVTMFGVTGSGVAEVRLFPPDRWVATVVKGSGRGSVYEYRLTPAPGGGSRLDVAYRIAVRRWRSRLRVLFARPFARRELHRMWEGFARSMAEELG
jgi:hypothetical protein